MFFQFSCSVPPSRFMPALMHFSAFCYQVVFPRSLFLDIKCFRVAFFFFNLLKTKPNHLPPSPPPPSPKKNAAHRHPLAALQSTSFISLCLTACPQALRLSYSLGLWHLWLGHTDFSPQPISRSVIPMCLPCYWRMLVLVSLADKFWTGILVAVLLPTAIQL